MLSQWSLWASQVVLVVKNPPPSARRLKRHRFDPWVRKILWRRKWQPTSVFLPREPHEQRSLVGYSPQGHKESDMIKAIEPAAASGAWDSLPDGKRQVSVTRYLRTPHFFSDKPQSGVLVLLCPCSFLPLERSINPRASARNIGQATLSSSPQISS